MYQALLGMFEYRPYRIQNQKRHSPGPRHLDILILFSKGIHINLFIKGITRDTVGHPDSISTKDLTEKTAY